MGHTDDNRYKIIHINVSKPEIEEISIRHHCGVRNEDVELLVMEPALTMLRQAAAAGDDEFRHTFDDLIDPSFPRTHLDVMRRMFIERPSSTPVSSKPSTWLASIKQTLAGIRKATR